MSHINDEKTGEAVGAYPRPHPYCIVRRPNAPICGAFLTAHAASVRTFLPTELAQIYNFPPSSIEGARSNIVVLSFGGGLFGSVAPSTGILTGGDLVNYWQKMCNLTTFPTVRVLTVGGAQNNPQSDDGATVENNLDVQILGAVAPDSNITLLIGTNFIEVLNFAKTLNPTTISCSWGFSEKSAPLTYVNQINDLLQGFAQNGVSICCAAGDNGASDGGSGLNVDFPGSSPFVVCCGGTSLISPTNTYNVQTQESVWNDNPTTSATGGGRSVLFKKPDFQKSVMPNETMRLTPDLAMDADPNTGIDLLVNGDKIVVGGTSAVSPLMSGYLARVKCSTFVTPLLYNAPHTCFQDITIGNNGGFQAGPGFDLDSGLGSINGTLLASNILGVPQQYEILPRSLHFDHTNNTVPQQLTLTNTNQSQQGAKRQRVEVTWNSSNIHVATVDNTGLVSAIGNGACNITCSAVPNQTISVTVQDLPVAPILATSVFILPMLRVGQIISLGLVNTQPSNATVRTLMWQSQQPMIASVDLNSGLVHALSPGIVTFIGTLQDSNHAKSMCSLEIV